MKGIARKVRALTLEILYPKPDGYRPRGDFPGGSPNFPVTFPNFSTADIIFNCLFPSHLRQTQQGLRTASDPSVVAQASCLCVAASKLTGETPADTATFTTVRG